MDASPSPFSQSFLPRRRRALLMIAVSAVLVLCLGLFAVSRLYPYWADGIVAERLVEKIEAKTKLKVAIADFDLQSDRVLLRRLVAQDEEVRLVVDGVSVGYSDADPWAGRVQLGEVQIDRLQVKGTRKGVEALAARLRPKRKADKPEAPKSERRIGLPSRVELASFSVELKQESAPGPDSPLPLSFDSATTKGRAALNLVSREVELWLDQTNVEGLAGRSLSAESLHTRVKATKGTQLEFPIVLDVKGGATRLTPKISVAGVTGQLTVEDAAASELSVDLTGGFSGGESATESKVWSLKGRGRRDLSAGKVLVDMEKFELGRLPKLLARLPLVDSERASVGGKLKVDFAAGIAKVEGNLAVAGLNVSHSLLAKDVVEGLGFDVSLSASIDPLQRKIDIASSELKFGEVRLQVSGTMLHPPVREQRNYDLKLTIPPVPCQAVLDSMPRALVPGLQGFALRGDFKFDGALKADFANLEEMELQGLTRGLGMDACRVRMAPSRAQPKRLLGDLNHRVTLRDGTVRTLFLAEGSETFTPLRDIAPEVAAAVLTTEDGGFWRHGGFILSQIEAALRRNLSAGKVRLGASTITMQMVKNLLLSHERTLSRKIQEVFATWYVERVLPKERIMELYLNVIEFGPGVYGVTRAAEHYFGKTPGELNSLEAAFLAMMLPSPVRRHEVYCKDSLGKTYENKLRRIHGYMRTRDRIDEDTYLMWKDAELIFDPTERGKEKTCLEEITRLLEAQEGQMALTGLLGESVAGRAPVAVRGNAGRRRKYLWGDERLPGERLERYHKRVGIEPPPIP